MQRIEPTRGAARIVIVGSGRLGTALAAALRGNDDFELTGPLGRGADAAGSDVVLLCVPDREIGAAAAVIAPGRLVGHCSGATGLEPLAPHEAFSLHPLMTATGPATPLAGATAVIDGGTPRALDMAARLARALRMPSLRVETQDRAAYHAAASIASNFLITLEAAAERLAASAGVSRAALAPLVRASVESWAALGPERALTGPVARGDERTVAAQRAAILARAPDLVGLFDALTAATRALAAEPPEPA
ncbi:MAG TPA: Rossmann-like and DUF2520 domain-containing protein [Solirubrobacteraceae bacterium]|nr:Rossmann-like and DUF2520 domain-containing protein [Solirubrobacteraceae bacterium]